MLLVVDGEAEEVVGLAREGGGGGEEPGAEAVGVDGYAERDPVRGERRVGQARELVHQPLLEHADVLHVAAEPRALLGGDAGRAPLDQDDAEAFLELLHPLPDRRGGHVERPRSGVEAAGLHHHGHGAGGGVVDHGSVRLM